MIAPSMRVAAIPASPTMKADARAKALAQEGRVIVNLAAGELDLAPPHAALQAAHVAIEEGPQWYGPAAGMAALREAVAHAESESRSAAWSPHEVVITAGAKSALLYALQALTDPGSEVILPAPYWVSFPPMMQLAGVVPRVVTLPEERGAAVIDALEPAVGPKTRAILINSPNNPSGRVWNASEVEALVEWAARHDVAILSDEIYRPLTFGDAAAPSPASVPTGRDRTVVVGGVSKAFCMTGWRIGWALAPAAVAQAIGSVQSHSASGPPLLNQRAALAALTSAPEHPTAVTREVESRARAALTALRAHGLDCAEPGGAFYLFPSVHRWLGTRTPTGGAMASALDLQEWLLEDAGVAVVAGDAFGAPGHMRLALTRAEPELEQAVAAIAASLERLG
jgi:aspartate aminotransferase